MAIIAFVATLFWLLSPSSYEMAGGLLVAAALIVTNVPLILRAARRLEDSRVATLLMAAFFARMLVAAVRYFVEPLLYGHLGDADFYVQGGKDIAASLQAGTYAGTPLLEAKGTELMKVLTGYLFAGVGPTALGGFFIFAVAGFWGAYWFIRAYQEAFPAGQVFRYALLVLFLPSMLYWPAAIGKEGWMAAALGLAAYGIANMVDGRAKGYIAFALGAYAAFVVRPHVGALLAAAGLAALVYRGRVRRLRPAGSVLRLMALIGIVVGTGYMIQHTEDYLGVDSTTTSANVEQLIDQTAFNTAIGGSEVEVEPATSIVDLPRGLLTVLFRPFPFEAHNAQALVASVESLFLVFLAMRAIPRLRRLPTLAVTNAYVRYVIVFACLFVFAWSSISNFGILVRQRTQVLPNVIVLLALPGPETRRLPATVRR